MNISLYFLCSFPGTIVEPIEGDVFESSGCSKPYARNSVHIVGNGIVEAALKVGMLGEGIVEVVKVS